MARWRVDLIGKRLPGWMTMAHARELIAKRRKANLIAEYEEQRRRPIEFVIVLVGIAFMAFLDAMLLVLAILVFCAAIFLTALPHIPAIVIIAAFVVIRVATR
jgi:hypothetical protein